MTQPGLRSPRGRSPHTATLVDGPYTATLSARDTDWSQIVALYDHLVLLDPTPIVRLNRAVAVAEVDGPGVALAELDHVGQHEVVVALDAGKAELLGDPPRQQGGTPAEHHRGHAETDVIEEATVGVLRPRHAPRVTHRRRLRDTGTVLGQRDRTSRLDVADLVPLPHDERLR